MRFPWRGGLHPWMDVLIETPTHLIGVESKRFEPFRPKSKPGRFSRTYWRDEWGDAMGPFERARDRLHKGVLSYECLDAVQLVKHAFGLRTQGAKRKKSPVLVYLFAEPKTWPADGKPVDPEVLATHRAEAESFFQEVRGAELRLALCTYRELLAAFAASPIEQVREHGAKIEQVFKPW